jgi:TetR/AcrR family transcriptional regulator, transcriptional repressor for nem operon
MPYPREHRDAKKQQLIRSARTLFNRKGFEAVSIEEIMSNAGLTRGGFYSYFKSKGELYALAVGHALVEPPSSRWKTVSVDFTAADAARQVIRAYLSQEHLDDIDGSCPMVSLPSDISRSDATVKHVFETVFQGMVGLFEDSLILKRRADRDRALTMSALCVGAMVIARALDNPALASELRNAAMRFALEMGGWSNSTELPRNRERVKKRKARED